MGSNPLPKGNANEHPWINLRVFGQASLEGRR